jgi:hypothetical protein
VISDKKRYSFISFTEQENFFIMLNKNILTGAGKKEIPVVCSIERENFSSLFERTREFSNLSLKKYIL